MSSISPDRWQAVSPYLDEALAMPEAERAAWLTSLRASNPALAAELQTFLREHRALADSRFLEDRPTSLESDPGTAPQQALAGQMVGAYKLLSPLGRGGMGTVWLAERSDGRALAAQGKRTEASAELRPALEQLQNALGPDSPETRSARGWSIPTIIKELALSYACFVRFAQNFRRRGFFSTSGANRWVKN